MGLEWALPLIGDVLDFNAAEDANQSRESASAAQMAFQERMSNTAHRREVDDLRAAGLNPILSAGGSGASTPSGSTWIAENPLAGMGNKMRSSASLGLEQQDVKNRTLATAADVELKGSQSALAKQQAETEKANAIAATAKAGRDNQEVLESKERILSIKQDVLLNAEKLNLTKVEQEKLKAEISKISAEIEVLGATLPMINSATAKLS